MSTEIKTDSEEFPHKVFVGNLSFKTTKEELGSFFAEAGSVVQVNIITRGTRSLGYGFVAFSSQAECLVAVEKCHKKNLGGRDINVEVAKPKSELVAAKKERSAHAAADDDKKPRRPKRRFAKKKTDDAPKQKDTEDGVVVSHGDKNPEDKKRRLRKKRAPRKPREPRDPDAPKPERVRRVPTGEPSKTTVFVANLPFALDDAGLSEIFKEYKVKTAKVVRRRGSGRSKGFGFVEVENEDEQQRLLATTFVSEARELNIKVALSEDKAVEIKKE